MPIWRGLQARYLALPVEEQQRCPHTCLHPSAGAQASVLVALCRALAQGSGWAVQRVANDAMESRRRCRRRRRGAPHLAKGASLRLGARRRHQRPAPPRRDLRRSFGAHRQSSPPRLGGDTGEQGGGEEGGGEEGLTIALEAHLRRRRRRGAPFAVLKAMRRPRQRPELRRKFGAASVVSSTQRHSVRRQMRAGAAGAGGRGLAQHMANVDALEAPRRRRCLAPRLP